MRGPKQAERSLRVGLPPGWPFGAMPLEYQIDAHVLQVAGGLLRKSPLSNGLRDALEEDRVADRNPDILHFAFRPTESSSLTFA